MNCARCTNPESNHTTAQHEQAMIEQSLCIECGHPHGWDDAEALLCRACMADAAEYLSEQASYYTPDEGGENG